MNGGDLVKIAGEEREVRKRPQGKLSKCWVDCIKEDGKQLDLSATSDRGRWLLLAQ